MTGPAWRRGAVVVGALAIVGAAASVSPGARAEPVDLRWRPGAPPRHLRMRRALAAAPPASAATTPTTAAAAAAPTAPVRDAVATRPGAESRREEGAAVLEVLGSFRRLLRIEAPGTLDGGDVLRIGKRVFVGMSARSNDAGRAQLRELLAPFGYTVEGVVTRDCLHLKSAVTQVAEDVVLINPKWLADAVPFAAYRQIEVDPTEEHAANAVRIGDALLYPDCFPRTLARLRAAGINVTTVDVSELQKAEGAVTCCSVLFHSEDAA